MNHRQNMSFLSTGGCAARKHRHCSTHSAMRLLFVATVCLVISACGYSLRGNDVLATKFDKLQLQLQQPNSEIAQLLRRSLDIASVEFDSPEPGTATPVLHLGPEQLVTRPVSVNPRARAAQYEIRVSIEASLTRGADYVMPPSTLQVQRSYFEDIDNIAGNQEEMAIIASEMRRELVNQLLRRLEASAI